MRNSEEARIFADKATRGVLSHAYIIDGDAGIGKLDFALECARAVVCTGNKKPCGYCEGCLKALGNGHPDIYIYGKEKAASIDDVREIIRRAGIKPNDSDKQVFIVNNAAKLREEAQNALLKIFEEPPETVVIFLLTDTRSRLLPTLLSRGQRIRLDGCTDEEMTEILKNSPEKYDKISLEAAVSAAKGNIGEAKLLLSKDRAALRAKAADMLAAALARQSYELMSLLVLPKYKRENLAALLDEFVSLISELSKIKYGAEAHLFPESEKARVPAEKTSKKILSRMGEYALRCRASLDSNVNVTAATTKLSIDLLATAAK